MIDPMYVIPNSHYRKLLEICKRYWNDVYDYNHFTAYSVKGGLKKLETRRGFIDPTANKALLRAQLRQNIDTINKALRLTDPDYEYYILRSVTTQEHPSCGESYEWLKYHEGLTLSRDDFFNLRHKFFWILDKIYFGDEQGQLNKIKDPTFLNGGAEEKDSGNRSPSYSIEEEIDKEFERLFGVFSYNRGK